MWSDVLPLAIAMMAGPQIISALVFITTEKPVKVSFAYIGGIALATTLGVYAAFLLFSFVFPDANVPGSGTSLFASLIEIVLIAALAFLAIRTYTNREESKPPKWLNKLTEATPRKAFRLGRLVIWLMPSDIIIMLTVGIHLAKGQETWAAVVPFILLVILIASLPVLGYLLFHRRMVRAMPGIHNWIDTNSWMINIFVYVLFIFIIL